MVSKHRKKTIKLALFFYLLEILFLSVLYVREVSLILFSLLSSLLFFQFLESLINVYTLINIVLHQDMNV